MNALEYWLWLSALEIRAQAKGVLLKTLEDPKHIYHALPGSLRGIRGVSDREVELLESSRSEQPVKTIRRLCDEAGIEITTQTDSRYPERLRNIFAAPAVLYTKGHLPYVDEEAAVAVIGTRKASKQGLQLGKDVAGEIVRCGGIVISGLTAGVDAAAAEGALQEKGVCLAVLGTPIGESARALGERVAQRGAVISEYPPGMPCQRSFYRERNRIAAGLSVGVVVVEAPEKSGTRLFAREALEQGKDVFAIRAFGAYPGSPGADELIQEGARPVTCGTEIMQEYAAIYPDRLHDPNPAQSRENRTEETAEGTANAQLTLQQEPETAAADRAREALKEKMASLPAEALQVITAIEKDGSYTDEIIAETGLSTQQVLVQLTMLEIRGFIRRGSAKRYYLNLN